MGSRHLASHFNYLDYLMSTDNGKVSYYAMVFNFYSMFLTSFEIPLIYRLTNSVKFLVLYYLVHYSVIGISLLLTPKIFYGYTLSAIYKIQILLYAIMASLLVLFYPSLDNVILLLLFSALRGCINGIFWFANHYSMLDVVKQETRDNLLLTLQSINVIFPVVIPVFGGLIINYLSVDFLPVNNHLPNGYIFIFLTALLFSILAFLNAPEMTRRIKTKIKYRKLFRLAHSKNFSIVRQYLLFDSAQSIIVVIAIGLLNFLVLKKELNLGLFNSVLAFLASYYFIFIRRLNEKQKVDQVNFYFTGMVGETVSRLMYFMFTNIYGLIIKATITSLIFPLKTIFSDAIIMHNFDAKASAHKTSKIYMILANEYYLLISRFISLSILLLLMFLFNLQPVEFAKAILLFAGSIGILDYLLIKRVAHE